MARARSIKPGFFKNEKLAELPMAARLLFAGLWTIADRSGRLEDRPKRIKAEVFPYENQSVPKLLAALSESGFIERYSLNGCDYIAIPTWDRHQNPHKNEVKSTIPAPEQHCAASDKIGTTPADSLNPEPLTLNSESGATPIRAAARLPLDEWVERLYGRHPKKRGKPLVEAACVAILNKCRAAGRDALALFQQIDRIHAPWCASEDWTKENAKYCPQLAVWLSDEGWTAGPPARASPATDHGPDTPSEMAVWRREQAERIARGEEC